VNKFKGSASEVAESAPFEEWLRKSVTAAHIAFLGARTVQRSSLESEKQKQRRGSRSEGDAKEVAQEIGIEETCLNRTMSSLAGLSISAG
jgi:hypothetical protein